MEKVDNKQSIKMARRLAKKDGLLRGIFCGAALITAFIPDSGERYD